MKLQRLHIVIVALIVTVSVTLLMKRPLRDANAKETGETAHRLAPVVLATRGPLENVITLSGEFRPFQQVDVHAKVSGYIRQIFVDVGDKVRAGQVLAVLEVPELNAQVMGAQADIRRSEDAIRRAQSEVERTESTHQAYHAAYTRLKQASEERPGLIAEQELDDALAKDKETDAQIQSTRAALAESRNQLGMAQATLDRLLALKDYSRVTAPFAGIVTKRYADTGALIQAGTASETQSKPVVQISEWSLLRLVIPVPESAVSQLRLGSMVQVHVSALNRDFQGRVARFADALNDETRTMHTEIDVENVSGALKEGMYAEATLVVGRRDNALTVPIEAVQRNDSGATVLIVDRQGKVQVRDVKLGMESSDRVEVLTGLAENDQIIVGSRSDFHSGEMVQPKVVSNKAGEPGDGL
jgi:RND family efflux transporter MFP subunit